MTVSRPPSPISALWHRVERSLLGPVRADVRYNVWVETIASVLFGLFWATTIGFFPVVLRNIGATEGQLAIYVVFQSFGLIFTPISAALFARFRIIKVANGIWMFGRSMMFLVPFVGGDVNLLLVLIGIFWVCELMPSPGYVRLLERLYPDNARGRLMSVVRMGMTATILLMTPIAGWMLDTWSYTVIFPAIGVVGILASVVFGQLRINDAPAARDPLHPPALARAITAEVLRNKPFLWFLLLNTLFGCGTLIGAPLYAIVQVNRLGLSYTEVGYLGLVQSLTWFLGYFFWGRITDRFGPVAVLVVSMLCGALMPLCFLFATSFWWLLPAFIGQGLLFGGFELGLTNTAMALANRLRLEMYFAVMHVVSGVRGIIVPLLTPVLIAAQVSEQVIFGVGTGLILVSVLIAAKINMPTTDPLSSSEVVQQEVPRESGR